MYPIPVHFSPLYKPDEADSSSWLRTRVGEGTAGGLRGGPYVGEQSDRPFRSVVVFRTGSCLGAVPLHHTTEILRPLPLEPVQGVPDFVLGLAVLRGSAVPVLNVSLMLDEGGRRDCLRWVALRVDRRRVVLAVDTVLGVRDIDIRDFEGMPPLLKNARPGFLETLGIHDAQLLLVLNASRILPEDAWEALSARGAAS